MFTVTVFEISLSEGGSVLSSTHQGRGSERVKVSVKNQKQKIRNLSRFLENGLTYKIKRFSMVFNFFNFI